MSTSPTIAHANHQLSLYLDKFSPRDFWLHRDPIRRKMSCLPDELWKLILVHIPLPERLGRCSRVSQQLSRAAAAATEQLELELNYNVQRFQGLMQWVEKHGQHIKELDLNRVGGTLTELPCWQLRQLGIFNGSVQLGPSSSHPGVLHSCNGLTKLQLWSCQVDGPDNLSALSAVPALQHLELSYISSSTGYVSLPGSVLQVLTQLSALKLELNIKVTAESLQHSSALQHLQVLSLYHPLVPLSPSSTPGLAQLTGLQAIKLSYFDEPLDAALLQHYTRLQQLQLQGGDLTGAAGSATLLAAIGQQPQLEQLELWGVRCEWPRAAGAYTALTASSRLQELDVHVDEWPAGVWQSVFRPQ